MRGHLQIPFFLIFAFCAVYAAFVWMAPQAITVPASASEATVISPNRAYQQLRAEVELFTARR